MSAAKDSINDFELNKLLLSTRKNNIKNNITGLLLHIDGDFVQVLEGYKKDVEELYEKIKLDKRHSGVILILKDKIEKRQFPDWSMGFKATRYEELATINGLKNFERADFLNDSEKRTLSVINSFIETHKNLMHY